MRGQEGVVERFFNLKVTDVKGLDRVANITCKSVVETMIEVLVTCDGRGKEVKRVVLRRLIKRRYRKNV